MTILDLTRASADALDLGIETVDIVALGQQVGHMLAPQARDVEVALRVAMAGTPPVLADEARLRHALTNLLSNAIKFTASGGSVSLSARPEAGGRVMIEVTDTGIGIDPSDMAMAFLPFGRIDSLLARRYEGVGLGFPPPSSLSQERTAA